MREVRGFSRPPRVGQAGGSEASSGQAPGVESGYKGSPLDHLHDVRGLSNDDLAGRVTGAGIDVLVDLNSYCFQRRCQERVSAPRRFRTT